MLAKIYPIVYIALVAIGITWYYLNAKQEKSNIAKTGFWILLLGYFVVVLFNGGGFLLKLITVLRDFAVLFVLLIVTNRLMKIKQFFGAFVFVIITCLFLFYYGILRNTFVFNKTLDPQAELLFDIKDTQNGIRTITSELEDYELTIRKAFPSILHPEMTELDDYYVIDIPDEHADDLKNIIEKLRETNAIDWIEQNEIVKLEPLDKGETNENNTIDYGINDPLLNQLWGFDKMNMKSLFDYYKKNNIKPKRKAKIAILDTGVDSKHEDIQGNFISTDKASDTDKQGHGTHCAGIAAAVSNNAKGIASFSPNASFISVTSIKVLNDNGIGSQKTIINGIIRAVDSGADVISLSIGGLSSDKRQNAYNEAIKYALKNGVIIVVAAGNENDNATQYVPASCDGVITVSAVDDNLDKAEFSNYVKDIKMGVAAPGVDILSTFPANKYVSLNGTSMATPYVAGLVGMMKSIRPNLNTNQVYQVLQKTGKETSDTKKTGKFIQPYKAIEAIK